MINLQPDSPARRNAQTRLVIVGPLSIYHESLVYVLKKEVCEKCGIAEDLESIRQHLESREKHTVLLIDSGEREYEEVLEDTLAFADREEISVAAALFNMMRGRSIEKRAFMKGVSGFFYRQDTLQVFLHGVDALLHGEAWIPHRLLAEITMHKSRNGSLSGDDHNLTKRELDVLALIGAGASNDEIGEKLCISPHTVKTHIYNVFKKLQVPNRLQAALWAEKNL